MFFGPIFEQILKFYSICSSSPYSYFFPFSPSFIPPVEIDDPTDKKPADWDDKEK